jgi:hypothetical protein
MQKCLTSHELQDLEYQSVFELGDISITDKMKQQCTSAFRIFRHLAPVVDADESMLFPSCGFEVEHDIDPLPDLQSVIDNDPGNKTFAIIKSVHERMAQLIHTIIPQIPVIKGYFYLLRVRTWMIHYVMIMSASGHLPHISKALVEKSVSTFLSYFPPLPVRCFVRAKIEISICNYLKHLQQAPD